MAEARDVPSVINVSGTMTALGASIARPEVAAAMVEILPRFVAMDSLHAVAGEAIAAATGAEAGFVTASASAGITLAVAASVTGLDLGKVEQLPDTSEMRDRVILQAGHNCNYGAPLSQAVRLAGAKVDLVGTATLVGEHNVRAALSGETAAGLFVVSHHVVRYGQVPLERFCELCHERGVPVIVDAASEYDLRGFLAAGADVVVYSAHKFLGGPTAGIVAGRRDLVAACFLQNRGIGRVMKVGKESIAGTIAALAAWSRRDAAAIRACEAEALAAWSSALASVRGVVARVVPDPTGNPLDRLLVTVDAASAGLSARDVTLALAEGEPVVVVRDHEVENGWFQLDPCNLHDGQVKIVADRLRAVFARASG